MTHASSQRLYQVLLLLFFLAAIFTPPVTMLVTPDEEWSEVEKRKLASSPQSPTSLATLPAYFRSLETYLLDHFGFRDYFIYRYYREIEKRFGKTGLESKVLQGKDGWYYFTADGQLEDFRGRRQLAPEELAAWVEKQNQRHAWLAERGMQYLLISPPGKQSIYPEYLPDTIRALDGTSRYEQLLAYTKNNPLPYFIDLQGPLLAAKHEHLLYYKTDTHWNLRGAYVAYTTLVEALRERFPGVSLSTEYQFKEPVTKNCRDLPGACDLARMAMRHQDAVDIFAELTDFERCAHPRRFDHYRFSNLTQTRDAPSFSRSCKGKDLTALVFRDSFSVALQPFLSENFRHIVYLWKDYDQQNVEEVLRVFTPDVVIDATVERNLFR